MRKIKKIAEIEAELCDKVWHNRCYLVLKEKIENGEHWLVEKWGSEFSTQDVTSKEIWEGAKKSAQRLEKKYGIENLGPYSDFDWGMINGKLSAIRWILGDDWDELYT